MPAATNVVPFITFGGLSVLAALLVMILPETGEEDLPDTVREAENLGEERCRMAKQEYDDNTLVRSEDCTQTQYSEVKHIFLLQLKVQFCFDFFKDIF